MSAAEHVLKPLRRDFTTTDQYAYLYYNTASNHVLYYLYESVHDCYIIRTHTHTHTHTHIYI